MKKIITLFALAFCLNAKAQIITTIAGNGTAGYSGDGGPAVNAVLNYPTDVSIDAFKNIYIADQLNNRIRKVDTAGNITTIVGTGIQGYSGDGGAATAAELYNPTNIIFNANGNLIFSDRNNNKVRMVNVSGTINTIAGNGAFGYSGDGGQAILCELAYQTGLATDNFNNIYIVDEDNNRIRKVDTAGIIATIVGNGTQGFTGDGGAATNAELYTPRDVAFDASGNLYIADQYNHCIRKVTTSGIITTAVGTGTAGYYGDGGQATNAQLHFPRGLTFDVSGNLYIADTYNSVIRKVNAAGIISTIVGNGTLGYSGDGGMAINAHLNTPIGITIDALGNLYIADGGNNRIRKVTNVAATGIKGLEEFDNEVIMYPNPTSNNFTIETSYTDKQTLQLFDVNGKIVLSQIINGKTNIDASNLAEGVYNLSLINQNGVANKRLVIVR